ncbi:MAG: cytochrome bd ubiquinol oxidase subunit I [Alphaproteobacteria bacterium]|nr:cytochrome bd ubiquinol oxidase subunit I [Alphaproteobacteria bacterium]
METIVPPEIILSRIQFALTLAFHILFPTLTIGLAGYITIWEIKWLRTHNGVYFQLCRFWTKVFALAFGMGVVSGIVLSYEFGANFSKFSELTGNILGPLMSYEVLTAFFLEAGFLGIMLFGWNRVSEKTHLFATLMVAAGTVISAFWIISANSWMHTPAGYRLENGTFYVGNWWDIIFNPSFPYRLAHMITASYLTTSFAVAGISAWYLLKDRQRDIARASFSLAMGMALVLAPLQLVIGDFHGLNTLKYQPLKIAALEGRWETERGAPLTLFAVPDMKAETNYFPVEVPRLGSLILTHAWDGEITGLKSAPREDRPYVPLVFFTFRLMVGIGLWMILIGALGQFTRMRGKLFTARWLHYASLYSTPLGFMAVVAGWFTTEAGRQPWVVYGLLRTRDAASVIAPHEVLTTLIAFAALYSVLLAAFIFYLVRLVKQGFDSEPLPVTAMGRQSRREKKQ